MASPYRIGHGFDIHRLRRGRKLVLGGVEIPYAFGLVGHSDADVLVHALINALLGAMGHGDIGSHFPDTDPRYRGISSVKLLRDVLRMMRRKRFTLINADVTLVAQKPKLAPFFGQIRKNLLLVLKISQDRINIKAATTEKLGSIGRGQAMAAMAVVLLCKRPASGG